MLKRIIWLVVVTFSVTAAIITTVILLKKRITFKAELSADKEPTFAGS